MTTDKPAPKYRGKEQTLQATVSRVSELVSLAADDLKRATSGEKVPLNVSGH